MQNAYMEIILISFRAERETNRLSECVCVWVCVREREKETTGDESNQLMEIQLAVQFHVLLTLKTKHWIYQLKPTWAAYYNML